MPRHHRAFTLLELLVVIGLVATLSFVLLGGLGGGGKSAALQSAQATLANLVSAARTKALAGGGGTRVVINIDPSANGDPAHYLRHLAIQTQIGGVWQSGAVVEIYLPEGVYVVPGNLSAIPAGLFSTNPATPWKKFDGSALRSTALRASQELSLTLNAVAPEQYVSINFASTGTTVQAGDIVLAAGHRRTPGTFADGESPVELENPENVRGLSLSTYGLPVLINDRASF